MKLTIFFNIFLLISLSIKTAWAQEISSTNSKSYEAKTIKKDNEIEIRLIPKNPPPKIEKTPITTQDSVGEKDGSALENEATRDSEIVYEKSVEDDNANAQDVTNIQNKNANSAREDSLKLWREEQRKLREERIEARKEEARKKYQAQRERSIIKEVENLNQKLKADKSSKNIMPNYYGGSTAPTTSQNQNSGTIANVPTTNNSNGAQIANSPNSNSNSNTASTSSNGNINPSTPPANIPTQNSR
jgi:hypothetical protein